MTRVRDRFPPHPSQLTWFSQLPSSWYIVTFYIIWVKSGSTDKVGVISKNMIFALFHQSSDDVDVCYYVKVKSSSCLLEKWAPSVVCLLQQYGMIEAVIWYLPCWVQVDITCGTSWHHLWYELTYIGRTSWHGYELTWVKLTWVRVDCHP